MESWLREFFNWLPSGGAYYLLIWTISFLESLAVAGIFVPGSVLIVFAGFLASQGKGDYALLVVVSTLGAILGDLVSYWLGARFGAYLMQKKLFRKRREMFNKAQLFFVSHGGKSVFLGRFVGFLRPFIPFVAGSSRMSPLPFTLFVLVSGLLWGLAYPGLGYFFGASWKLVRIWTGRFSLLIVILAALFILNGCFWKWGAPYLARHWARSRLTLANLWQRWTGTGPLADLRRSHPRPWSFFADRFTARSGSGLYLTAGLLVSALFAVLFVGVAVAIRLDRPLLAFDHMVYREVQNFRHPALDTLFLVITFLGSAPVLLMGGGLLFLWLVLKNRDFSAVILVVGMVGGNFLVFALKWFFSRHRPESLIPGLHPLTASFPSAHAFLALVFYGLAVYMLLDTIANLQSRFLLVLGGTSLALLIGFSRVYLGVHWLSDVLGGLALASLWLTFLITASEMRRRYGGEIPWRKGVRPLNVSLRTRFIIMILAGAGTAVAIVCYVLYRLAQLQ